MRPAWVVCVYVHREHRERLLTTSTVRQCHSHSVHRYVRWWSHAVCPAHQHTCTTRRRQLVAARSHTGRCTCVTSASATAALRTRRTWWHISAVNTDTRTHTSRVCVCVWLSGETWDCLETVFCVFLLSWTWSRCCDLMSLSGSSREVVLTHHIEPY